MTPAIPRCILTLEDGMVTVGPWTRADLRELGSSSEAEAVELFVTKIEAHPWGDVYLNLILVGDVIAAWAKRNRALLPRRH